jgi:hypothetical protein
VTSRVDGRVRHRRAAGVADALLAGDLEAPVGDVDALLGAGAPAVVHDDVAVLDRGGPERLADLGVGHRRTGDDQRADGTGGQDDGRRSRTQGVSQGASHGDSSGNGDVGALPQYIDGNDCKSDVSP